MFLFARPHRDFLVARRRPSQIQRPCTFAFHGFTGIVDDDELLVDRFARQEIVVLAGEGPGLAAEVCQERLVVAKQRLRCGGRNPVRHLEVRAHRPLLPVGIVRDESGPLQFVPVHLEVLAALVHAVAQLPEHVVFPRRVSRDTPAPKGSPVVGDISSKDVLAFVKIT